MLNNIKEAGDSSIKNAEPNNCFDLFKKTNILKIFILFQLHLNFGILYVKKF